MAEFEEAPARAGGGTLGLRAVVDGEFVVNILGAEPVEVLAFLAPVLGALASSAEV